MSKSKKHSAVQWSKEAQQKNIPTIMHKTICNRIQLKKKTTQAQHMKHSIANWSGKQKPTKANREHAIVLAKCNNPCVFSGPSSSDIESNLLPEIAHSCRSFIVQLFIGSASTRLFYFTGCASCSANTYHRKNSYKLLKCTQVRQSRRQHIPYLHSRQISLAQCVRTERTKLMQQYLLFTRQVFKRKM